MKRFYDFEDIRPFYDEEVNDVISSLIKEDGFKRTVHFIMPELDYDKFAQELSTYTSKDDFQAKAAVPILLSLVKKSTTALSLSGIENIRKSERYTFMSNHRDIVLDASFLNLLLWQRGFTTSEVAIGNNLLKLPWISNLVRLNKSFIVKRNVSGRKMLEFSHRLSAYIHFAIKIKHQSVWIAQREGRAKDSDDRTQESLIKMLALGGNDDLWESIRSVNIVPVSISYEYDPCDYLKAREFQMKRDNPRYKKSPGEDILNMATGILGYKGKVVFRIATPINQTLAQTVPPHDKADEVACITHTIDQGIHSNYEIYAGNYVAYDLLFGTQFEDKYTPQEKETFMQYLDQQLGKIEMPNPDIPFLKEKILEMYANPLRNKLIAENKM